MKYIEKQQSLDGSVKYLWKLSDCNTVESIYLPINNEKYTCISSQIGCNVKCTFCETGKQRSLRNLTPSEIFMQVFATIRDLNVGELYQVAFAGMGEPLFNLKNVISGSELILDAKLCQSISLSTSGIVPKIYDLVNSPITKLFISLHATTDATRNLLVPMNYPIKDLLSASNYFYHHVGNKIVAAYLLFENLNDTDSDLDRLMNLLDPSVYTIRLSVWNRVSNTQFAPSHRLEYFFNTLQCKGYDVFVLNSMGSDIEGGCGQFRSRNNSQKK